jgi:hypothetical protein
MEGAEISRRSRNTWRQPKYREEVGIYEVSRTTGKKSEFSGRSKNTC